NQTKTNNLTWLSEQTINYKINFGKNHLAALAGWTAQKSHTEQNYLSGSFLKPQYRHLSWEETYLRDSVKQPGTTGIDEWALISYLGRITYDFDGNIYSRQISGLIILPNLRREIVMLLSLLSLQDGEFPRKTL